MMKKSFIQKKIAELSKTTGMSIEELTKFFNKTMAFLDTHTSCTPQTAALVALNEIQTTFVSTN